MERSSVVKINQSTGTVAVVIQLGIASTTR